MRHSQVFAALAAGTFLLTAGSLAPATAAPGKLPVHIVAHTSFDSDSLFDSSVPGCETGLVVNGDNAAAHFTPWGGVFVGDKVFTCEGGESGFTIALRAQFGENGSRGTWTVVSGFGDYVGLRGSGSLVGIPVSETVIDDVYTGSIR